MGINLMQEFGFDPDDLEFWEAYVQAVEDQAVEDYLLALEEEPIEKDCE